MKNFFVSLFFLVFLWNVSAKENLDSVLKNAGNDITNALNENSIVCILNFSSSNKEMSEYIQTQLNSIVTESKKIKLITRNHLDKIQKELDFQMSGWVSDETALSICKMLGANAIVLGKVTELGNQYNLTVSVLEVETASYILYKTYAFSRSAKTEELFGRAANYCKSSLGFLLEGNKNSVLKFSPGAGIYFDYNFTRRLTMGIKTLMSYDVFNEENSIYTLEPAGFLRIYLVSPSGEPSTGIFIEADGGLSFIFVDDDTKYSTSGGINLGFRKGLNSFYIEPNLRVGYPYMFGAGLNFGLRF